MPDIGNEDTDPRIVCLPAGPYLVRGVRRMVKPDGELVEVEGDQVALCACGRSESKPYCTGAHKTCAPAADAKT